MRVRVASQKNVAAVLGLALSLALQSTAMLAGTANPGILPINSSPEGKSYGSWAVAWWQWALSIPDAQNPAEDTTGANAGVGQTGGVWFLGSTFGDLSSPIVRTFTVPPGKLIFMPVYQWVFGA